MQEQLLDTVKKSISSNIPVIVALMSGSSVDISWALVSLQHLFRLRFNVKIWHTQLINASAFFDYIYLLLKEAQLMFFFRVMQMLSCGWDIQVSPGDKLWLRYWWEWSIPRGGSRSQWYVKFC